MQHPERLLISGSMEDTSVKYTYGWREWYLLFCAAIIGISCGGILLELLVLLSVYAHG